jgi:hypothetical protein
MICRVVLCPTFLHSSTGLADIMSPLTVQELAIQMLDIVVGRKYNTVQYAARLTSLGSSQAWR